MISIVRGTEILTYCSVNKLSSENTNFPIKVVESFSGSDRL